MTSKEEHTQAEDVMCDPNNPVVVSFEDVTSAAFKIKHGTEYTPCPVRYNILQIR